MIIPTAHIPIPTVNFDANKLKKQLWLVLLHANRIPPHVGLIINGSYNSLTIKGHELDIDLKILLKTISQKKIESTFIKIVPHPVFSCDYQLQIFKEYIKKIPQVTAFEASCLTPVKLFFQEFYALQLNNDELLFEFIERLNNNNYLDFAQSLNFTLSLNAVQLPSYTKEQLNDLIIKERLPYYNH